MMRHVRILSAGLGGLLIAPAALAGYVSAPAWNTQLSTLPGVTLAPLPAFTETTRDAFGTMSLGTMPGGSVSGVFGCDSFVNPCRGAYSFTITLPYAVSGIEGTLAYRQNLSSGKAAFGLGAADNQAVGPGFRYAGFWGDFFAPSTVFTVTWPGGVVSTDDTGTFTLGDVQVVRAAGAPAPGAAIWMAATGLLAAVAGRRRG